MNALRSCQFVQRLYEKHMKDSHAGKGCRVWQKHVLYEQMTMKDRILPVVLCEGIKNATNIRSFVLLNGLWGTELGRVYSPDLET